MRLDLIMQEFICTSGIFVLHIKYYYSMFYLFEHLFLYGAGERKCRGCVCVCVYREPLKNQRGMNLMRGVSKWNESKILHEW